MKVQKAPPVSAFHELRPPRGLLATFYLRIYSRQHTSLQGVLAQAEKNCDPATLDILNYEIKEGKGITIHTVYNENGKLVGVEQVK